MRKRKNAEEKEEEPSPQHVEPYRAGSPNERAGEAKRRPTERIQFTTQVYQKHTRSGGRPLRRQRRAPLGQGQMWLLTWVEKMRYRARSQIRRPAGKLSVRLRDPIPRLDKAPRPELYAGAFTNLLCGGGHVGSLLQGFVPRRDATATQKEEAIVCAFTTSPRV